MAGNFEFDIDSRTKLGSSEVEWSDGDDFNTFVRLLNSGTAVSMPDGLAATPGEPADLSVDAVACAELIAKLSEYR